MKRVLDDACVAVPEFARLCGVSKNMVYKWIKGAQPHALRVDKVKKILAAIKQATDEGELPLSGVDDTRTKRLNTVVISNIKKAI